jgi:hypothetical protein
MKIAVFDLRSILIGTAIGFLSTVTFDSSASTGCPRSEDWPKERRGSEDVDFGAEERFTFAAEKATKLSFLEFRNSSQEVATLKAKKDDAIIRDLAAMGQSLGEGKLLRSEVIRQNDLILVKYEFKQEKNQKLDFQIFFKDRVSQAALTAPVLSRESEKAAESFLLRCARGK